MHNASPIVPGAGVRFWQAQVQALDGSGLSRREYCRRHRLSYHALTYWVRKFQPAGPRTSLPALVEVSLPLARGAAPAFRLHLGQSRLLEIEPDFDEVGLGRLLRVLEQR